MDSKLPSIVVTGVSGFIGRYFLDSIKESYNVYAVARRSQKEADVPDHNNVKWFQCDIGIKSNINELTGFLKQKGKIDFIVHMAAYYDFDNVERIEYKRTNVDGTKNMLELAKELAVKRFIFISSIAACDFPEQGNAINEKTPAGISQPYAKSKKIGEAFVKEYSSIFPCLIVRLTAVFSDWCEYAPLYKFLETWLSKKWDSRILGGRGESAIPYIYIQDVIKLFNILLEKNDSLPRYDVYIVSPDGSTSHKELFKTATRDFFGRSLKPIFIPKPVALIGLAQRGFFRRLNIAFKNSFERIWMLKYLDAKLSVEGSYTRKILDWEPVPRYHILRRMLYLLDKMKSHPVEWKVKNEAALKKVVGRPGLMISEAMMEEKEKILEWLIIEVRFSGDKTKFNNYRKMEFGDFKFCMSTLYHLLVSAARSGDRSLILNYIDEIAMRRFSEGFEPPEICAVLSIFNSVITSNLLSRNELQPIKDDIYFYIGMTIQLAQDEIEDLYESLDQKIPKWKLPDYEMLPDTRALHKLIRQLSALYRRFPEEKYLYDEEKNDEIKK